MNRSSRLASILILAFALSTSAARVHADATVGFVEDFPEVNGTSTWAGGSVTTNPGTGGFGGDGDGYLLVGAPSPQNLGTVSFGNEYFGDWITAGIERVRCRMQDFGGTGDLLIHLSIGDGVNTWQQDAGFVPPIGSWGEYTVNLVAGDFTHIRGASGTFASAMAAVDRLHFRHDVPAYGPTPDPIEGEFGLDHLELLGAATGVPMPRGTQPVMLDAPYPNPARGPVTFALRQPEAKPVRITILDAAGRRVRDLTVSAGGGATQIWMWDGRDDGGARLPAGVYRVLARGDNGGMSRTVTLLR